MRLKTLSLIPLAALALAGCINEDAGECDVPDNLELVFTYDDAPGEDFNRRITMVDVFLFNAQEYFLEHRRVESGTTARFTVPAGTYHAVAWGNVASNSAFSDYTPGVTTFDDCFVEISAAATHTGDPVYYAPHKEKPAARGNGNGTQSEVATRSGDMSLYAIEVPQGKKVVKTLDFVRAHRTINVWIADYDEMQAGQAVYPIVTVTNRWSRFNFLFDTQNVRRDYTQQSLTQMKDGALHATATFHSALGRIDSSKEVILTSPTDNSIVLPPVNLLDFIAAHPEITDTDEIDILITFPSAGDNVKVTITVPSWGLNPVSPNL